MKEIWIDNYSISEMEPGFYCISKNGTPCVYLSEPRGLIEDEMKAILLDFISKVKGDYTYGE